MIWFGKWLRRAGEFSGYVVKIAAAWSILVGVLYFIFEPRVQPYLNLPTTIAANARATQENTETLQLFGQRIADMEVDLRDLAPDLKIAEYDEALSFQVGKCYLGKPCAMRIRFRRTEYGKQCDAPKASPKIINHFGQRYPTTYIDFEPIQGDTDWQVILFSVLIPDGVIKGSSRYYAELIYSGCYPDNPAKIKRERSIYIQLHVE